MATYTHTYPAVSIDPFPDYAKETKQDTGNASLASIDGKLGALGQKAMAGSAPVVIASDQSAIPASQSGTWNINNISGSVALPTGAATETTLSGIGAKLGALGQANMAGSAPVVIASDQSAVPASQSGTWNINNVSGTVSLPTGAATETTLSSVNGKLGSLGQKAMAGSAPVVIASDQSAVPASQSGTWNINNVSGTVSLPTGAATETTLSGINAKLGSLGQTTMAGSAPVVIASNQSAIPASQSGTWTVQPGNTANTTAWLVNANTRDGSGNGITSAAAGSNRAIHANALGRSVVTTVRKDYSSGSVTTSAWTQLVASTSAEIHELEIFDSSGNTMEIGIGAASSESRLIIVFPGGNGRVPVRIDSGSRISVRAVSATASSGELDINAYGV